MDFDNEDDYQPGSYSPVMRGAERPLAPDHLRRVRREPAGVSEPREFQALTPARRSARE